MTPKEDGIVWLFSYKVVEKGALVKSRETIWLAGQPV